MAQVQAVRDADLAARKATTQTEVQPNSTKRKQLAD